MGKKGGYIILPFSLNTIIMGKTLANIVDSIIEYVSGFQVTDDNKFDKDIIADKVHDVRINLIYDELQSKGYIDDGYYVLTRCIKIIKEDMICDEEDECANIDLGIWTAEIPTLIERVGWANIKYLGTVNFTKSFTRKSLSGLLAMSGNRYTYDKPAYTLIANNKLMFKNVDCQEVINMLCLPKIPTQVCDWNDDTPYPVPDAFKLELIVKKDIFASLGIPADEFNNTKHDMLVQQPKKTGDDEE